MATDRRAFLQGAAASTALGVLLVESGPAAAQDAGASVAQAPATSAPAASEASATPFSFDWLVGEAQKLASAAYQPGSDSVPDSIKGMTYDQYRDIRFKPEAAIWAGDQSLFHLDLLHLGFVYKEPVQIAIVANGAVTELPFSTQYFTYGPLVQPPSADDSKALGFSGFRVRYPINTPDVFDEFLVFQGASYFRGVARNQVYGLSARGLAINTAEPEGEEFPVFRKFWIKQPAANDDTLSVYALLDSKSVTGAYHFRITPGADTVMEVQAAVILRSAIKKVGIAPLTSMFLFDSMNRAGFDDYRRGVHDSDGLQMLTGAGEWIWRPLDNPHDLQVSDFSDQRPRGFGLIQRARRFEAFEDTEAKYEWRPSLWIEPIGDWGKGSVELVEIPTDREVNDNIVAYWRPNDQVPAGGPRRFSYRMRWTNDVMPPAKLLWVATSRQGLSFDGKRRLFAIDFSGGEGAKLDPASLKMDVSASKGDVQNSVIHGTEPNGMLRVSFELDPGSEKLSELRLLLTTKDGAPASETWLYRWTAS